MKKVTTALLGAMAVFCMSCQKSPLLRPRSGTTQKTISAAPFKNVVILGNSITYTPGNPSGEWRGSWGMAATAADSDYVHRLTARFHSASPDCVVTIRNIVPFEADWKTYDLQANLGDLKNLHPDLLILRIGENVQLPYDTASFGKAYQTLTQFFGTKTVVLGVGSFWPRPLTDQVMAARSAFISLAPLGNDLSNYSLKAWKNPGIQQHPNDKGMRLIADMIWTALQTLETANKTPPQ